MNEIEMIQKVQQGDMYVFEQLFQLYKHQALKTVYLMTGDKIVSEDIVQEAFVACYRSIGGLKHPEYFKTWFFKLLTRTTWHYMKKERKLIPVDDIIAVIEQKKSEEYPEQGEVSSLVYEEVLRLDSKLQTTLILYYYNEFSVKEIAKIMGCFEGTVKSRLYTARNKLKLNLVANGNFVTPKEV